MGFNKHLWAENPGGVYFRPIGRGGRFRRQDTGDRRQISNIESLKFPSSLSAE
jgi:hypothetical protein